ncbi:hypothetical protein [Micromonospora sp. DH14]|uniref:hypothetical protein n=1 Tax=Micromonospora sp. DH14 TaxID=3040120 RepID=UPI002442937D|nr:hypothetical protein [Micromonospora sp. DH14]MDG9679037.1 hypothetical protein [Micromonospora sp. DH14]
MGRNSRPLADIESDLIATTDPARHAELRDEIRAAGLPLLAAELDRIAAEPAPAEMDRDQVIAALVDLFERSGWSRLEIVRAGASYSGYCLDNHRQPVHLGISAELANRERN